MRKTITVKPFILFPVLAVLLGIPALSAGARIEGQILNGTTNQPLVNQKVVLISPQGGMAQVGETTTDARGHFVFSKNQIDTSKFYLLQATYQGVDYNAPVKFDSSGNSFAKIKAYESTHQKPALRISSARIIVRAEGSEAHVQELFALNNPLERSYDNPRGTFLFRLPSQVEHPTVAVAGLMNMPLPQAAEKGNSPGHYYITYALKPGLTVVMVAYKTDYTKDKLSLAGSVPYPIGHAELFVLPPNLTVSSKLFSPDGKDQETGSQKLVAERLAAGTRLAAEITGQAAAAAPEQANSVQEQPQVKIVPDSVSAVGVPFLLCFLLVLLWALGIRASKEYPRWKAKQEGSPVQKKFQAKMEAILNSIADLDELFSSGKIAEKQYWKERLQLKAKAVAILKKEPSRKPSPYAARKASH